MHYDRDLNEGGRCKATSSKTLSASFMLKSASM